MEQYPVRLGDMTSEAFTRYAALHPVVLLPLGSQEDHGPNLPMGDYLLAEVLAVRIAETARALGTPTLVAPTLPFGVADYFENSPGGMAISSQSFQNILAELIAAMVNQGISKIVLLNGHGGNAQSIHKITSDIRRLQNIVIPSIYLWKIARKLMEARLGPDHADRFGHGAEPLLSLNTALRPHDVHFAAVPQAVDALLCGLPVTDFGTLTFSGMPIDVPTGFEQVPRAAADIAAQMASSDLGHDVADKLVVLAAKFIAHFAANAGPQA
jgi:creatinine amidohydrolase